MTGQLTGPMMVACHWKRESPDGPAEQEEGGSRPKSNNSSVLCKKNKIVV
jgi:hypothetical protein